MATSQISLSKALKYRKRVENAVSRVTADIQHFNVVSVERDKPANREVDVRLLMSRRELLVEHLIDLNTRLNAANVPIHRKIIELRELKGTVAFLRKISTDHGPQHRYDDGPGYENHASYRKTDIDEFVKAAEMQIDSIQDELDQFNATTKIELSNFGIINQ